MTVLKNKASMKREYYRYLDEVQNLCNTLMDFIVYNDRQMFTCLIAAFFDLTADIVNSISFANPHSFPLT